MQQTEKLRFLIQSAYREGNKKFNHNLDTEVGITSSQSEVLTVLKEYQPLSLADLGNLLLCESKSPSRVVKRLIDQGYIEQKPSTEDSRKVILHLAQKGEKAIPKIKEIEANFNHEIEEKLENLISVENLNTILMKQIKGTQSEEKINLRSLSKK